MGPLSDLPLPGPGWLLSGSAESSGDFDAFLGAQRMAKLGSIV